MLLASTSGISWLLLSAKDSLPRLGAEALTPGSLPDCSPCCTCSASVDALTAILCPESPFSVMLSDPAVLSSAASGTGSASACTAAGMSTVRGCVCCSSFVAVCSALAACPAGEARCCLSALPAVAGGSCVIADTLLSAPAAGGLGACTLLGSDRRAASSG